METATCIVAIKENGKIWMGSDSLSIHQESLKAWVTTTEKVFIRKGPDGTEWIFGYTNSYRYGQILKYDFSLRDFNQEAKDNPEKFMVTKFMLDYISCMERGGFSLADPKKSGSCLVGVDGNLFRIGSDLSIQTTLNPYMALGCGEMIALGSLYSTVGKTEERITTALRAAEEFSAGVRGPFIIKSI